MIWGTGWALREFLYADDMADAGIFLLNRYDGDEPVNVETGEEVSMMQLALMIAQITHFGGHTLTDADKPDGMMRRICGNSKIAAMGWRPKTTLRDGLQKLYEWYINDAAEEGR